MERPMDSWNDERLDELNRRVDGGFTKVDGRFERLEGEMKNGFAKVATKGELGAVKEDLRGVKGEVGAVKEDLREVKRELGAVKGELGEVKVAVGELGVGQEGLKGEMKEVKVELGRLNERFDKLLHALMVAGVGLGITVLGTFGGFVVTQV